MPPVEETPVTIPLAESAHVANCPALRVETYEARRPNDAVVTVVRCCDCGGQSSYDGGIARVARKFNETTEKNNGRRQEKQ